ncbi:MAG: hypothetical protein M1838_000515 [Thelocarpon superellum]|nr:MAG: hypothetical protein M1838_000515 [Thelocarpon superellum]
MEDLTKRAFVPALPPPPGVTSNLEDPEFCGMRLFVICGVFTGLILICTVLRLYTRLRITNAFGIDDCALILATLSSIALVIVTIIMTYHGLGYHMWDVSLLTFSPGWLAWDFVASIVYTISIWLAKLAVLLLYLRLFPKKETRIAIFFMLFVITGQVVSVTIALFLGCTPFAKVYDVTITYGSCLDKNQISIVTSGLNVATDIILLVLPLPTVYKLNLPKKQKMALIGVFMLGALVCAISIIRLAELRGLLANPDFSWTILDASIWGIVEIDVSIVCSCLVVYQPLLRKFSPAFFSFKSSFYSNPGSGETPTFSKRKTRRPRRFESYILGTETDGTADSTPLELGDGPKAKVTIYAQGGADLKTQASDASSTQEDRPGHDHSTEHINPDVVDQPHGAPGQSITKTTKIRVKQEQT